MADDGWQKWEACGAFMPAAAAALLSGSGDVGVRRSCWVALRLLYCSDLFPSDAPEVEPSKLLLSKL